ncbi:hypothetical protein [uncultured Candidatus Kuenenia sp.]|uniref:hypothetical protein n=1 Tax=uncultured Candidatus Kuenenia sp. TaxID=1048336 RepID=UPI0025E84A6A|nr:hypothetical protein [uncultured Candidatus Kuenenia sp.]
MDLLYRVGGLSGVEIREMMGVDYSTVYQGRKRLREKLKDGKHISKILERVEANLSTIKICPPLFLLLAGYFAKVSEREGTVNGMPAFLDLQMVILLIFCISKITDQKLISVFYPIIEESSCLPFLFHQRQFFFLW